MPAIRKRPAVAMETGGGRAPISEDRFSRRGQEFVDAKVLSPTSGAANKTESGVVAAIPPPTPLRRQVVQSAGVAVAMVPLTVLSVQQDASSEVDMAPERTGHARPRRCRIRPLDAWRNERLVYERVPGSLMPTVAGAELNLAPPKVYSDRPPRQLDVTTLQVPAVVPERRSTSAIQFKGLAGAALESQVFSLPGWVGQGTPKTVLLEAPEGGLLYVYEGAMRFAAEHAAIDQEVELRTGDCVRLQGRRRQVLVAPARRADCSSGARFILVRVHVHNPHRG